MTGAAGRETCADDGERWQPAPSAPKNSKKTNDIHLTGDGKDMTDNLAENQGYKQEYSPAKELQAQLKADFQQC
jgi:hypothetical protein